MLPPRLRCSSTPCIGVGFEQKLLILPVYVLCTIYLDLTLDPNDPNEPNVEVIILISPQFFYSLARKIYYLYELMFLDETASPQILPPSTH